MKKVITLILSLSVMLSVALPAFAVNLDCTNDNCECCTSGYCSLNLFTPISNNDEVSCEQISNGVYHYISESSEFILCEIPVEARAFYDVYLNLLPSYVCIFNLELGYYSDGDFVVSSRLVLDIESFKEGLVPKPGVTHLRIICSGSKELTMQPYIALQSSGYADVMILGCTCSSADVGGSGDSGSTDDTPTTETIIIKEERPLFETPLSEYTVTEGLLLLLLVVTILNSAFKSYIRG